MGGVCLGGGTDAGWDSRFPSASSGQALTGPSAPFGMTGLVLGGLLSQR